MFRRVVFGVLIVADRTRVDNYTTICVLQGSSLSLSIPSFVCCRVERVVRQSVVESRKEKREKKRKK